MTRTQMTMGRMLTGALGATLFLAALAAAMGSVSWSDEPANQCGPYGLVVRVDPPRANLLVGQSQAFTATVYCMRQDVTSNSTVSWSVNGTIGSVSPSSGPTTTFTATAAGQGGVVADATYGSDTGKGGAFVIVEQGGGGGQCLYLRVSVNPRYALLQVGATQQFDATVTCNGQDVTSQSSISWQEQGGAGTISPTSGPSTTFTAAQLGFSRLTASATYNNTQGIDGAAAIVWKGPQQLCLALWVEVSPRSARLQVGDTQQFDAKVLCDGQDVTAQSNVTWSVQGNAGTVSPTSGPSTVFTASEQGGAFVMASADYQGNQGQGGAAVIVQ